MEVDTRETRSLLSTINARWPILLGYCVILYSVYGVALITYRLFFSPISHFPGPKLAAATHWVEVWYDVFRGGQFTFKIEEWHRKYGPVIRISPLEVHISDAEFHETLYSPESKYIKVPELKNRMGIADSTFETVGHEHHKLRRGAISSFFSRQSILRFSDFIQQRVDRICTRLQDEWAGTGRPVSMNDAWATLTADVIIYYAFASDYKFAEYPDFVAPYTRALWLQLRYVHVMAHFPWFLKLLESLPRSVLDIVSPSMGPVFDHHHAAADRIEKIRSGENVMTDSIKHRTVFHDIFDSDLPPQEKTLSRLSQEASSITSGGIDTTKTALSIATFFILNDPVVYQKLSEELKGAIPDPNDMPSLPTLETLPYLSACINESIRLSFGIVQRSFRISPDKPIHYHAWTIPPGTRFGMSTYMTHRDPHVFPHPEKFVPERWLDGAESPSGRRLERYIFTFGRGPRACLGINLAKAEIYIGLATLFRRVKLGLYETTKRDVWIASEHLVALPPVESKGVRVLVHGA